MNKNVTINGTLAAELDKIGIEKMLEIGLSKPLSRPIVIDFLLQFYKDNVNTKA